MTQPYRVAFLLAAPALVALLVLTGAPNECRAASPLVGLCGQSYRAFYVAPLESIQAQGLMVSGQDLRDPAALERYQALIIVSNADPSQQEAGLPAEVERNVAAYVRAGGRVLCTFGCAPPVEVLTGSFASPGPGSDWFVADSQHPLTEGLQVGRVVRYGAYRYGVSGLGPNGRVLLREADGSPAVTVVSYGHGELIQTCGDLGATADADATTGELLSRVLLYLVYGRVQARFGPVPAPAEPAPSMAPQVETVRQLALPAAEDVGAVLERRFRGEGPPPGPDGYEIGAGRGEMTAFWVVRAPAGTQAFAPWLRLSLGDAEVKEGLTYRLTVEARLNRIGPSTFAPAHFELRFFDSAGIELPHPHVSTQRVPAVHPWQTLTCQDTAPAGAVRASVTLSAMLPTGSLWLNQMRLAQVLSPAETFVSEKPLTSRIAEHPRVFLGPSEAKNLPQWVSDNRETPFGASRAELFEHIRQRADGYLTESEITFGDQSLPWPPNALPDPGGGLSWNVLGTALADRLASLSLVHAATGQDSYGRRAAQLLTAISRWPQWHDPVNGTPGLDIGYIAFAAAYAYDLTYPLLSTDERALVQEAIRRNVLLPLYSRLSVDMHDTNGYALWTTVLGLCSTATLGEVEGAATCVRLAEDRLLDYWDERATNHRSEGQGYDSWAYGLQLTLADSLQRNFGAGHLDHPLLRVFAPLATYFLAGDRVHVAWFADAGGVTEWVPWDLPLTILAARAQDGLSGWYLRETGSLPFAAYDFVKLLYLDAGLPVTEPDPDRPGAVFPRAGWAALRSGWEKGGTLIALQCSSANQGHSHQDQNNVLIYRGGENLAMDCGYASALQGTVREFARGAVGHNTVLVEGKGQIANRGSTPFFATSRAVDYVMGDASAAYSAALLRRFHRHLVYLKPDILLMVDDLRAADGAQTFQWLLHPHSWGPEAAVTRNGEALVVGAPAAPGPVEISKGDEKMRLRFLNPPGLGARYVLYPGAESYRPYLQVDTPQAEAVVLVTLFEFGETRAEAASLKVEGGLVSLSYRVSGTAYQVILTLAGEPGASPRIHVAEEQHILLESNDLTVPLTTPG